MLIYAGFSACGRDHARNDDRVTCGCHVLEGAETADSAATLSGTLAEHELASRAAGPLALAVFDGVGGSAHGDRAAGTAAHALANRCAGESLNTALDRIEREVSIAEQGFLPHERGCTVAAGIWVEAAPLASDAPPASINPQGGINPQGDTAPASPPLLQADALPAVNLTCTPFNAGDVRVYRFRTPYLAQLTHDHSLAQELRDLGQAADGDPLARCTVTRYLGAGRAGQFDASGPFPLLTGDIVLVCCDGVWDALDPTDIEARLAAASRAFDPPPPDPDVLLEAFAAALGMTTVDAGSTDDVSLAVLVRLADPVPAKEL